MVRFALWFVSQTAASRREESKIAQGEAKRNPGNAFPPPCYPAPEGRCEPNDRPPLILHAIALHKNIYLRVLRPHIFVPSYVPHPFAFFLAKGWESTNFDVRITRSKPSDVWIAPLAASRRQLICRTLQNFANTNLCGDGSERGFRRLG